MRAAAVVLALSFVLAGCAASEEAASSTSSAPSSAAPSSSAAPTPEPEANATRLAGPAFELLECINRGGTFSLPRSNLEGLLPDGFEPVASNAAAAPPDSVVLYAIELGCGSFTVDGVTGDGGVELAYAEVAVTPSPAQAVSGIADSTVPLFFGATDATLGAALAAHGLGVAGAADLGRTAVAFPQGLTLDSFSIGSATLDFIAGQGAPETLTVQDGDFVLYGVQGGEVVSRLRGSVEGGSASYASVLVRSAGAPGLEGFQDGGLGFSVVGFSLRFTPLGVA